MKIEMSCRKVVAVKAVIALVVVATTSLSHRLGQLASIFCKCEKQKKKRLNQNKEAKKGGNEIGFGFSHTLFVTL